MVNLTYVVKKFLCDYCKCIFVATKADYEVYKIDEYENGYRCRCHLCGRVATQVLGNEIRVRKGLKTIKDFKK